METITGARSERGACFEASRAWSGTGSAEGLPVEALDVLDGGDHSGKRAAMEGDRRDITSCRSSGKAAGGKSGRLTPHAFSIRRRCVGHAFEIKPEKLDAFPEKYRRGRKHREWRAWKQGKP